jgi:TolB-like protein/class 3 adenylate cyclase/cytochrome c-type biogenesis protein CcmH/NrfG
VNTQETSANTNPDLPLEIAHILLIDVVGYSKLLVNEQIELLQELNRIVRSTDCFRAAEAAGKLIRVPTGDGMALLFFRSPEEPVRCALETSRTLKDHPHIQVRMGVHSGPVARVKDVNDKTNFAGSGINVAQRVLDCGDAGHILLSGHVAKDLADYRHWQPCLHDLGECEVKHGLRLHLFNLYKDGLGNPQVPVKLSRASRWRHVAGPIRPIRAPRWPKSVLIIAMLGSAVAVAVSFLTLFHRGLLTTTSVSSKATAIATAASVSPEKSIAVLPFENLSDEKENAYFADGIQDEVLGRLSKIADLKVISRTSTQHYKSAPENLPEIAKQLGVANVVEGSVQRSGNRVRVNAKLVDARTDRQLWGQTYDRDLADVFAIQSEIAKAIAEQLHAKLSATEKSEIERPVTDDINAFDLYIRAMKLVLTPSFSVGERPNLLQAIDLLNQSVVRDPSFSRAYCQLAFAHDALYFFGHDHTSARLALAEAALQEASRLRPDGGETHLARAWNLYWGYLDYDGALAELEVARQTLPNDPQVLFLTGLIQRRQGHWEESIRTLKHAVDLDPRNFGVLQTIAENYATLGRYAEQQLWLGRVLAFEPNDAVTKLVLAEVDFEWRADTQPLHQMVDSVRATNSAAVPGIADWWLRCALAERDSAAAKEALITAAENPINLGNDLLSNHPFVEGVIARIAKDDDKARSAFTAARAEQEKIIQAQPNFGPPWCLLGLIDAALGRKEEALREGRHAVELLPVEKDAVRGPAVIKYLAMIAAWVGDKDLACEQLGIIARPPSPVSYGQLKLLPFWDPLRGDPRFEKIVASLAPK